MIISIYGAMFYKVTAISDDQIPIFMASNPNQLRKATTYKLNPKGTLYFHAHSLAFNTVFQFLLLT